MNALPSTQRTDTSRMSRTKKEAYLLQYSEDDFRDLCVRPLFERLGFKYLRDTCGPEEEGKDCVFLSTNRFLTEEVVAVQTKKGRLTNAGSGKKNMNCIVAIQQLKTALSCPIVLETKGRKSKPHQVILCTSGKVTEGARRYIVDEVNDTRVHVFDADWLIPRIDELMPEFWSGIYGARFPYLKALRARLLRSTDTLHIGATSSGDVRTPITDDAYTPIYTMKYVKSPLRAKQRNDGGQEIIEVEAAALLQTRDNRILLLGEGGSGKTTAMRRLAYKIIEDSFATSAASILPVFLRASKVLESSDVLGLMLDETRDIANTEGSPISHEDLVEGKCVLLVDGLDEVANESNASKVLRDLVAFHTSYPGTRLIVSSREYAFINRVEELLSFTRYRMIELSLKQALAMLQTASQGKDIKESHLKEVVRKLQDVHGLALSPMLVSIFASASDVKTSEVPPNITEVFKKYTELMLGRWHELQSFHHQYQAPLKDLVLQHIALAMHEQKVIEVDYDALVGGVTEQLELRGHKANAAQLCDEIVLHSNLLVIEDGMVRFRHHLFQEFFAGRAISDAVYFAEVMCDDWWRLPMVFHFGENSSKHGDLVGLVDHASKLPGKDAYASSISIGLASQACYFAPTQEKIEIISQVVNILSKSFADFEQSLEDVGKYPLTAFIYTFLLGKDAVASECISEAAKFTLKDTSPDISDAEKHIADLKGLWTLVGLVETGKISIAHSLAAKYSPSDPRLLLALDMACFVVERLRLSSPEERKLASKVRSTIAPKIGHLVGDVMSELSSRLFELRQGQIVPLPDGDTNQDEPDPPL